MDKLELLSKLLLLFSSVVIVIRLYRAC